MNPDDKQKLARQFIEAIPHARALGLQLDELAEGRAVISMPYDLRLVGDPASGVIHGGAVSTLMDTCCGASVMSHPSNPRSRTTKGRSSPCHRPAFPRTCRAGSSRSCYHRCW